MRFYASMGRVAVELRDGRAVLVRTGGDELRREASCLALLAGPGVPEVVEVADDGGEVRLVTVVHPPLAAGPDEAVRVAAAVAAVLARAHERGRAHGPLLDEHVRGSAAAVIVDGWGAGDGIDPAEDVAEVGALLDRLAGDAPGVRPLVERATAPGRPTMAGYALALAAAVPVPRPAPHQRPRWNRPLPGRTAVAGLGAAASLTALGLVVATAGDAHPPSGPTATVVAAPTTTAAPPVGPIAGNVLERDGERWAVGETGDVVVLGDWDCDGTASPAVLRPSTGEVWVFPTWAEQAGTTAARVPGATTARARRTGRCDRLEVVDAQGQSTPVAT